jgi:Uncharacterized conserved protein (DUF2358)
MMTQATTPTACITRWFMLALYTSITTTSSTTAAAFTTPSVAKSVVRPWDRTTTAGSSLLRLQRLTRCMSPSTTDNNEQDDNGNQNNAKSKSKNAADVVKDDVGLLARASWYAVEAFGNVFAAGKSLGDTAITSRQPSPSASIDFSVSPSSLQETLQRIQLDNDRSYFLSGDVDTLIYDQDCIFADPFVSFRGRDRFVDNLKNLGSFITKYDTKLLEYTVDEAVPEVTTKLMVKLELNLPWKPVLAWPWGVKYSIDVQSLLVTEHRESWDISPLEGVKQIFRKPTTRIR